MSCPNCKKSLTIFTKVKLCKNCNLSFCSGCVKRKLIIPKSGNEGNVCVNCEELIINQNASRPPPDALQRRLDFLEQPPPSNPITVYTTSQKSKKMSQLKRGLSQEDQAIADRLEKLKKERKASMNIPSESEMQQRLMKLKGMNIASAEEGSNQNNMINKDLRSDFQKTRDLVEQANAEVQLENKFPKPEDEIQERLAKLRGQEIKNRVEPMDVSPADFLSNEHKFKQTKNTPDDLDDISQLLEEVAMDAENDANVALREFENDEDLQKKFQSVMQQKSQDKIDKSSDSEPEEEVEQVVRNILSEQKIEEKYSDNEIILPDVPDHTPTQQLINRQILRQTEDDKELPWCTICNEDAVYRCVEGCDGDLYCSTCFNECHDEIDANEHKKVKFKKTEK